VPAEVVDREPFIFSNDPPQQRRTLNPTVPRQPRSDPAVLETTRGSDGAVNAVRSEMQPKPTPIDRRDGAGVMKPPATQAQAVGRLDGGGIGRGTVIQLPIQPINTTLSQPAQPASMAAGNITGSCTTFHNLASDVKNSCPC